MFAVSTAPHLSCEGVVGAVSIPATMVAAAGAAAADAAVATGTPVKATVVAAAAAAAAVMLPREASEHLRCTTAVSTDSRGCGAAVTNTSCAARRVCGN